MRQRDPELSSNWGTICTLVEMTTADGKKRNIQAANTEGLLRIIQSVTSPKAEPFKRWLAKVGYERLEEIENPELVAKRMREIYHQKGYSHEWIEKRVRGIAIRDELDDLRDHMTDLELIFSMLGEASITEIAKKKDVKGFTENKHAAKVGRTIAGNARRELEVKSGTKISTKENYKGLAEVKQRKLNKEEP